MKIGTRSRGRPPVTCLAAMVVLSLLLPRTVASQQGVEVSFAGLAGMNTVAPGGEILIYSVEVTDIVVDARNVQIGGAGGAGGIQITLTDRLASGIAAADFTGLNLYRSADGVLDGGDTFLRTEAPVAIGAALLVDFTGVAPANRAIPDVGSIFFLVTADIAAGATLGGAFRLGTAGLHIDMRDFGGGGPTVYPIGTAIAANDANYVVISAGGGGGGSSSSAGGGGGGSSTVTAVPFEHAWLLALLICAYGMYAIYMKGT